jgi:hypothetical protein
MTLMLPPYERLGQFYLGNRFDLSRGERTPELVLYDSRDLVTHAVCVGMTGSGKTALGMIVMEEAALDGVPVLAIDVKGDLANLALTFPDLSAAEFQPWIDPIEAARRQMTTESAAAQEASAWKAGLAEWDQEGDRIRRVREAAEVRIYTPGSRVATPLSMLTSIGPRGDGDPEEADVRATSVAASLLSLAGVRDSEAHSREQALIAAILSRRGPGDPVDLPSLVQQIQRPSFDRIGVLDLETFFPARERQELALRFNSVLATPGFEQWTAGDPLDVAQMLYTPDGRPRIAIVSVAHLDDARRMTAVSLVLNAVVHWTRRQSGTSSLRALVYMDEVFGYLPPVANPPSKTPLLTLLKQARASGVGVMLATQNPVDLDYKALANTGTWFLGKLQTERDKERVLDGLEGVTAAMTRDELARTLSRLRGRVFLLHNVHEQQPVVFETRWTLSYLRGPMSREELRRIAGSNAVEAFRQTGRSAVDPLQTGARIEPDRSAAVSATPERPVLPAGITEYYLPSEGAAGTYVPVLYGSARVDYQDARLGGTVTVDVNAVAPLGEGPVAVDWDSAASTAVGPEDLLASAPNPSGAHAPVPEAALNPKRHGAWTDDFQRWVVRARPLRLFAARALKLQSRPGESEGEFRLRVRQAAHERRDAEVDRLRKRYATKTARAVERIRRAEEGVERESRQAGEQKVQTAVSFGAALAGALLGRKVASMSTLGRAATAARGVGRAMKEQQDVAHAQTRLVEAQDALRALEAELQREIDAMPAAADVPIETIEIKPKRTNVDVRLVSLAWQLTAS